MATAYEVDITMDQDTVDKLKQGRFYLFGFSLKVLIFIAE